MALNNTSWFNGMHMMPVSYSYNRAKAKSSKFFNIIGILAE